MERGKVKVCKIRPTPVPALSETAVSEITAVSKLQGVCVCVCVHTKVQTFREKYLEQNISANTCVCVCMCVRVCVYLYG